MSSLPYSKAGIKSVWEEYHMQQDNNLYDEVSKEALASSGKNISLHKLKKNLKAVTLQNKCGFRY